MDAEDECSRSVPDLVTHLATLLLKKELAPKMPTAADVAKKRTRIYEALFLKGSLPTESKLELFNDVCRELEDDCKLRKSLKDLQVLMGDRTLEESVETEDAENDSAKNKIRVLRPGPLRLVESYEPAQEYMENRFSTVLNSVDQMQRALKPIQLKPYTNYFRMNPISKPPEPPLGVKFQPPKTSAFSGIAESMARIRNSKGPSHILPFRMPILKKKQPSVEKEPEFICDPKTQKAFLSDQMLTNELKLYANKDLVLNYVEESVLVEHLKRAAAGLQSETIIISPKDSHKLLVKPNIALRTALPEVVAEFADPFLRSGRALRRLSARVKRSRHVVTRLEKPVTRALREAIVEFISNSRHFLLSIRANSIIHLLDYSLPTMLLLQHLEKMFYHEPRLNLEGDVTGPFLLSCIWSAIDNCSNSNFLKLLIYLLRCLCQTYFVHLKRWLFQGELDETMNEIFITRSLNNSHMAFDEGSKEFFDRGYMVIKESVPNFLSGCEDDILQCGKYNQVLKAYNPQHPVFDVELPELVVCLEEQQLKETRRNLAEKYSAIYQRFGWCSMQSIFEERMAAKRSYKNLMVERTQAHLAAWEEQQQILLLASNAQKKLRYEEFNKQKALQEKLRLEQRREEVVREIAFQAECERMENRKWEKLKPELEKEVGNLQIELETDKESHEMVSPVVSINSDRSFVSCQEGPDSQHNSSVENNEEGLEKEMEATDDTESEFLSARGVPYNRTVSDVVNSNEEPILQTELSRNRQHMQSSEQFQECQTWVKLNQQSKSQRTESDAPLPSDLNANVSESLSELQINRLRMNHHDPFESFNSTEDEHIKRMQISLASETERARNRRRVMDSEYNIILGDAWTKKSNNSMSLPLESNKLHVDVSLAMLTPMSTTSDVDIGSLTPAKDTSDSSNKDEANNNNQEIGDHRSPITNKKVPGFLGQIAASFKPTFLLPTNDILTCTTKTQTEKADKGPTFLKLPKNCNPFMIRRCLQLSVMAPVNAHYALLRNEVLRIFQELRIYDHFRKLRNYFFLLDGQFGTLLTSDILGRINAGVDPRSLCQKGILDSILGHALASCSDEITVAQNLILNCSTIPDSLNLYSVEATSMLKLDCKVDWPLNLVISPETITKYGEVFGYLLKLRHVTFVLEGTFDHLQQMGKLLGAELRTASQFRQLQMSRHKLAHFMTSLQTHLVANALQGSWEKFKEQLCTVNSIEGLYQKHAMYLKRVAFMAHLNRRSAKVRETIDKMLIIILRFCKVIHSQSFVRDSDNDNVFIHPRFKRLMQEEAEFEKFMLYLIYLGNKAAASGYQDEIGDLISVINFNKYYKVADQESVS